MKKFIFASIVFSLTTLANAVPNAWFIVDRQGGYNAVIRDVNNNELNFGCMLDDPPKWHMLDVTYKGKNISNDKDNHSLSFLVNNQDIYQPAPSSLGHIDTTHWNNFLKAMPKAKKIEVYNKNKLLFILQPRNGLVIKDIPVCSK